MGIESVHDQHNVLGLWVVNVDDLSQKQRPLLSGSPLASSQVARSGFGFDGRQHATDAFAFLLHSLWLACFHLDGLAGVGQQLLTSLIQTKFGKAWIIGTMGDREHIFHVLDKFGVGFWRNAKWLF